MVNAKSVAMSAVPTGAGGRACTSSSAPAMAASAAAIHCRRSPTWSTSGDQKTLAHHGARSRLRKPIAASETPCTRK